MASPTHVVLRAFEGPGGRLETGALVAADGWKNVRPLESLRYIRPLGPADLAKPARKKE